MLRPYLESDQSTLTAFNCLFLLIRYEQQYIGEACTLSLQNKAMFQKVHTAICLASAVGLDT